MQMRFFVRSLVVAIMVCGLSLKGQTSPMFGNWKEPTGAVIRIEPCSSGLCFRLVSLSPQSPEATDIHNPNAAQRNRALCNLEIGSQFHLSDQTHAYGGMLYDPKSGKTYRGEMEVEGDSLHLRGYVGMPIFGRTEIWQRASGNIVPCRAPRSH
jgi:uncharacterized protein (DUF2147 family)